MRREDVSENLREVAFDFFYYFSRFEFALKENGYLKSQIVGEKAEADWDAFCIRWREVYSLSGEAIVLLRERPARQIVGNDNTLAWKPVGLDDCKSELEKVVRLLRTIRNNLFHGGKHGHADWHDAKRNHLLLTSGRRVLDQIAELASTLQADYFSRY